MRRTRRISVEIERRELAISFTRTSASPADRPAEAGAYEGNFAGDGQAPLLKCPTCGSVLSIAPGGDHTANQKQIVQQNGLSKTEGLSNV